jgi:3-phenylpropionate/trans-cinnamate dioxygenase ferredoxin subunit
MPRILIRTNGPYVVPTEGLELVDADGNVVPLPEGKDKVSLCRCGASSRKPFCDGTHSKVGFQGAMAAAARQDAAQASGATGGAAGGAPQTPGQG